MKHFIFYNTSSGKIESNRICSLKQAQRQVQICPHWSFIEGYVDDVNKKQINTETQAIEDLVVPTQSLEHRIRQRRDLLLYDCDWTQNADSPLSDSKKAEWATYRQALRDITDNITVTKFIDLVWPTKPS
jgi:hypothetical protein